MSVEGMSIEEMADKLALMMVQQECVSHEQLVADGWLDIEILAAVALVEKKFGVKVMQSRLQ